MKLRNWFRSKSRRKSQSEGVIQPSRLVPDSRFLASIIILFLIVGGVYFLLRSDLFLVRRIEAKNEEYIFVPSKEVENSLSNYLARSVLSVNVEELQSQVHRDFPAVETVTARKKLPDTVVVEYTERIPVLVLQSSTNQFLVDQAGVVFALLNENNFGLPVILFPEEEDLLIEELIGTNLSQRGMDSLLQIVEYSWGDQIQIEEILYQEDQILLTFQEWQVRLLPQEDLTAKLGLIPLIMQDAQREGKKLDMIDLRFNSPVVRYR